MNVYAGGGTIDNNGTAITIGKALSVPAGFGMSGTSIAVPSGGSGYIGVPFVKFSGGSGTGATGNAVIAGGVVTSITITNPGVGYLTGETLTATFVGGGAATAATAVTGIPVAINTSGAMTFQGSGTTTLSGTNTYTGTTTVAAGIVEVNGTALADTGKLVITSGKVAPTGTEVVDTLYFGAAQQASGTWGATGSGATNIDDTRFSGTAGTVSVTTGPPVSGYNTWAAANAGGQTPDLDFDNDGVRNGVEFFFGATGSTFTPNPVLVGGTVTWPKSVSFTGTYKVETSTDLVNWTDVTGSAVDNGTSVTYTPTTVQPARFVRLSVFPN
ncbi:MAG: autotransporter-associated beta strand repeat-containing protein [Luteolibacter sp.]